MEGGLPMLNCLLQHALRSLCTWSNSSNPSRWVYAVFWRILPRNYPPPKWDSEAGCALDRAKGNKRNWILVWEDGFCDFCECERAGSGYIKGRFGADVFFKMSHEVYNYGEGLVGKVAADNSHKWVFMDSSNENDPSCVSSWNVSIDPQPKAWEVQFKSGIQTIAVISVREGIIQLGSFDKVLEDLNLVITIQRKFSYLQSIPGIYAIQRPYLPIQHHLTFKSSHSNMVFENKETVAANDDKFQLIGSKRHYTAGYDEQSHTKSVNFGFNSPQVALAGLPAPIWPIPPLLPSMSCGFGALMSKAQSVEPSYNAFEALEETLCNEDGNIRRVSQGFKTEDHVGLSDQLQAGLVKVETLCITEEAQDEKPTSLNPLLALEDEMVVELGFNPPMEGKSS